MRRLLVSSILATGLAVTGASGMVSAEQPVDSGHSVHEMDTTHQNLNTGNFKGEGFEYTVKPGDTLATIAEEHLGSADKWEVIARANGIERPDQIEAGQTIVIPLNPESASASSHEARQDEDAHTAKEEADNGMSAEDRQMKGEITEINADQESLTLTDENGNIHSLKLDNEDLLEGIEVGDFVTVEIEGNGTVISVEKVEKKA